MPGLPTSLPGPPVGRENAVPRENASHRRSSGGSRRSPLGLVSPALLVALSACRRYSHPPRLDIEPQRTYPNLTIEVPFYVSDEDTSSLTITASSSDQSLVAEGDLVIGVSRDEWLLSITPVRDAVGVVEITVTVEDNGGQAVPRSFPLLIRPPHAHSADRVWSEDWIQQHKVMSEEAVQNAELGCSLALSGQYAIVGAVYDDRLAADTGVAYVLEL